MRERKPISGIAVLCADPDGEVIGDAYLAKVSDLRERKYLHKMKGEHWGVMVTSVAQQYPFPEIGGFVPESVVALEMARDYDEVCVNEPLRIYYQNEPDALSRVRRSYGWVLHHRAVVRRDWKFFFHAPVRIGYSVLVSLLWFWKKKPPLRAGSTGARE